jgi:hypothetical protein
MNNIGFDPETPSIPAKQSSLPGCSQLCTYEFEEIQVNPTSRLSVKAIPFTNFVSFF